MSSFGKNSPFVSIILHKLIVVTEMLNPTCNFHAHLDLYFINKMCLGIATSVLEILRFHVCCGRYHSIYNPKLFKPGMVVIEGLINGSIKALYQYTWNENEIRNLFIISSVTIKNSIFYM